MQQRGSVCARRQRGRLAHGLALCFRCLAGLRVVAAAPLRGDRIDCSAAVRSESITLASSELRAGAERRYELIIGNCARSLRVDPPATKSAASAPSQARMAVKVSASVPSPRRKRLNVEALVSISAATCAHVRPRPARARSAADHNASRSTSTRRPRLFPTRLPFPFFFAS